MSHRKGGHEQKRKKDRSDRKATPAPRPAGLEIVLKCDSAGCLEAVSAAILAAAPAGMAISIIHAGVGAINKTDIFLAETGSRLILGFNVGVGANIDGLAAEHGVEIRLYDVIYRLIADIKDTATSLLAAGETEEILGRAKVVALFKSSRKGIILGCEILEGRLAVNDRFRVITAMGPVYTSKIGSLHIGRDAVQVAKAGHKVGLKIPDFKNATIGDLVESFLPGGAKTVQPWTPRAGIFHF
jgi:translation initiation factor IF-2